MNDNKHGESEKAHKHKKLKSKRRSVLEIGLNLELDNLILMKDVMRSAACTESSAFFVKS